MRNQNRLRENAYLVAYYTISYTRAAVLKFDSCDLVAAMLQRDRTMGD